MSRHIKLAGIYERVVPLCVHELCFVFSTTVATQSGLVCNVTVKLLDTVYVTVFWKTDHIDTRTEIHLLPVRDRHTHALSRNTKH